MVVYIKGLKRVRRNNINETVPISDCDSPNVESVIMFARYLQVSRSQPTGCAEFGNDVQTWIDSSNLFDD